MTEVVKPGTGQQQNYVTELREKMQLKNCSFDSDVNRNYINFVSLLKNLKVSPRHLSRISNRVLHSVPIFTTELLEKVTPNCPSHIQFTFSRFKD